MKVSEMLNESASSTASAAVNMGGERDTSLARDYKILGSLARSRYRSLGYYKDWQDCIQEIFLNIYRRAGNPEREPIVSKKAFFFTCVEHEFAKDLKKFRAAEISLDACTEARDSRAEQDFSQLVDRMTLEGVCEKLDWKYGQYIRSLLQGCSPSKAVALVGGHSATGHRALRAALKYLQDQVA